MDGLMMPTQPTDPKMQGTAPGVMGGQDVLDEGAAVVTVMHNRLKAFAQEQPDALQQVQTMLTPEVGFVIGVLFGVEPLKVLEPMINKGMVSKSVSKGAMERIGLDKFESMMSKADDRSNGIMSPRKQASGQSKPDDKATKPK